MRQRNLPVKVLGKGLEVHIGSVDVVVNVVEGVVGNVTVRDHHRLQAIFPRLSADVDDVFAPDGRLVIREGEGIATVFQRQERHIFRRNMLRMHLIGPRFRNVPVLTEEAAHVTACRAHAENTRAGQEMIQRLFLDGIHLQSRWRTISQTIKLSVLIDAYEAESSLTGSDVAMPRTEVTVDFPRWF